MQNRDRLIHLGYRVSPAGLLAPEPCPSFSRGILGLGTEVSDFDADEILKPLLGFAKARSVSEIWLDMPDTSAARSLCGALSGRGMKVCSPFGLSGASLVIKSDVISGGFARHIRAALAQARGGCSAIEFVPVSIILKEGGGTEKLAARDLFRLMLRSPKVVFSEGLQLNTISFRSPEGEPRLALFDDEATLPKKLALAAELGVGRVFIRQGQSFDYEGKETLTF